MHLFVVYMCCLFSSQTKCAREQINKSISKNIDLCGIGSEFLRSMDRTVYFVASRKRSANEGKLPVQKVTCENVVCAKLNTVRTHNLNPWTRGLAVRNKQGA